MDKKSPDEDDVSASNQQVNVDAAEVIPPHPDEVLSVSHAVPQCITTANGTTGNCASNSIREQVVVPPTMHVQSANHHLRCDIYDEGSLPSFVSNNLLHNFGEHLDNAASRNLSRNHAAVVQEVVDVPEVLAAHAVSLHIPDLPEVADEEGAANELAAVAAEHGDNGGEAGGEAGGNDGGDMVRGAAGIQYNWQASKPTLKERLAFMYNNEVMADVHFVVGRPPNMQRVPAHRFVLAVGSAVFDAMFHGGMATTAAEVELPDVEPAAFLALLRFLYSDDVAIGPETVMTTLYTAKKYAVPALERACVDFLKRNLSADNAFMLLSQARLFDEPQLAALCLDTIDRSTSEALAADGFTDVDRGTLCVVLERDSLGVRESKLFNAARRWAEAECGRQSVAPTPSALRRALGPALRLLRFPLMTVEEFAQGAAQSGLLTDREVVQLFLHFTVNPKPPVDFLNVPRCCLTGREQVVSRFCQIESRWGYSGTSDRIRFTVNRKIFVVGFGLYGSIHGPMDYTVNIQIIQTDTGEVCSQNDTRFQCDGSSSTFRVTFKEPVEIEPNTSYTACTTLKGPDSYYGTKGLRKVTHESVTCGKVTFQFTYAAGNNNGTSVEDGQIPEIIFCT